MLERFTAFLAVILVVVIAASGYMLIQLQEDSERLESRLDAIENPR